jgi:membrane-associated protein
MQVIIVCRFIPGGRTAVTLSCGLIGYQRRRFVVATAVAAVIWALYAFFIGRLGGKAFEDRPRAGFLVAFGGTVLVSALIEAARRIRSRRKAARTTQRAPGTRPYWHVAILVKVRRIAGRLVLYRTVGCLWAGVARPT